MGTNASSTSANNGRTTSRRRSLVSAGAAAPSTGSPTSEALIICDSLDPAEQAFRTPQQNRSHQDVDAGAGPLREHHFAERIGETNQQSGDERAPDRADAADDHDDEADDQNLRAHARVNRRHRRGDHPGERSKTHAEREHETIEKIDVETQRL